MSLLRSRPSHTPAARTARRFSAVAWLLAGSVTLAMGGVLVRVAQLQVHPSQALREHFEPRVTRRIEIAPRPDIVDRRNRPLSVTRFGSRAIVDPTLLPQDLDVAITRLAAAIGVPANDVGQRILRAVVENESRLAAAESRAAADSAGPPAAVTSRFMSMVKSRLEPIAGLDDDQSEPTDSAPADASTDANTPVDTSQIRKPIRYLAVSKLLTDEQARAVRQLKIPGVSLEKRQVREYPGGAEIAAIVGKVDFKHAGLLGAEKLLNKKLTGHNGHIDFVRDARGNPMWIEPDQIEQSQPGEDVRLSVDLEIQRIVTEEVNRGMEDADSAGGRGLVVDPASGEILAMVDLMRDIPGAEPFPWADEPPPAPPIMNGKKSRPAPRPPAPNFPTGKHRWIVNKADPARLIHPALARNRCVEDVYEPGSTFKPYVWSTITELGLVRIDEVFETGRDGWRTPDGRWIRDVHARDSFTWDQVLVQSSNIGMIKGAQRMTPAQLHDAVIRFGFGKPTNLGLPGESPGIVTSMKNWKLGTQVSVAFGNEIAVTPVQMARAFCAFARPGEYAGTLPRLRLTVDGADEGPGVTYRVLPATIATLTRETMKGVTGAMETKYCQPPPGEQWRYMMFGKSGTAKIPIGAPPKGKRSMRGVPYHGYLDQYRSSFVAGGPLENPRLVVLVIIDDPGPDRIAKKTYYGSAVAGPVVRRIMERALTYLGTPPSPPETTIISAR